jgi:hypothetical protein
VAGAEWDRGVDLEVVDSTNGDRLSPEHGGESPTGLPGLSWPQGLERRLPAALEYGEQQLDLGRQGVAVKLHRRLAGQADLECRRNRDECLRRQLLDSRAQLESRGGPGHAAILSTACPRRPQLTAERENIRIEP